MVSEDAHRLRIYAARGNRAGLVRQCQKVCRSLRRNQRCAITANSKTLSGFAQESDISLCANDRQAPFFLLEQIIFRKLEVKRFSLASNFGVFIKYPKLLPFSKSRLMPDLRLPAVIINPWLCFIISNVFLNVPDPLKM